MFRLTEVMAQNTAICQEERGTQKVITEQQFDSATTNYYQQDVACRGDNTLNI